MAGNSPGPSRETERHHERRFESSRQTVKLLLDAGRHIAETRCRTLVIIGRRKAQFCARTDSKPQLGFSEIDSPVCLIACFEQAILRLKLPLGDDCARIRDGWPICRDHRWRLTGRDHGAEQNGTEQRGRTEHLPIIAASRETRSERLACFLGQPLEGKHHCLIR